MSNASNMVKAKFHSLRGEKSALILIKASAFQFSSDPVYVPRTAVVETAGVKDAESIPEGFEFEIPGGFTLVDIVDSETGEVRTAQDGSPLKQLQY